MIQFEEHIFEMGWNHQLDSLGWLGNGGRKGGWSAHAVNWAWIGVGVERWKDPPQSPAEQGGPRTDRYKWRDTSGPFFGKN